MRSLSILVCAAVLGCRTAPQEPPAPGTIRGTVRVAEMPKVRPPYKTPDLPGGIPREDVVVDAERRVQWAFVYVERGFEGRMFKTPVTSARVEIRGYRFLPHVLGVQAGQPILVRNSDATLSCFHAVPLNNPVKVLALPNEEVGLARFQNPEVMIQVQCDVHPWMKCWIGVLDHPFFSVTSDAGAYELPGLPPGRCTITVWHEAYKPVSREVEVVSGGETLLDFVLDARK